MQHAHTKPVAYGVKKADVLRQRREAEPSNTGASAGFFTGIRKIFK